MKINCYYFFRLASLQPITVEPRFVIIRTGKCCEILFIPDFVTFVLVLSGPGVLWQFSSIELLLLTCKIYIRTVKFREPVLKWFFSFQSASQSQLLYLEKFFQNFIFLEQRGPYCKKRFLLTWRSGRLKPSSPFQKPARWKIHGIADDLFCNFFDWCFKNGKYLLF